MTAAENIDHAYRTRKAAKNWALWESDNKRMAKVLVQIETSDDLAYMEKQLSEVENAAENNS